MSVYEAIFQGDPTTQPTRDVTLQYAVQAKIGLIITSSPDTGKVYERFAEQVRKPVPVRRIVINTLDPERGTFTDAYLMGTGVPGRRQGSAHPLRRYLHQDGSSRLVRNACPDWKQRRAAEAISVSLARFPRQTSVVSNGPSCFPGTGCRNLASTVKNT